MDPYYSTTHYLVNSSYNSSCPINHSCEWAFKGIHRVNKVSKRSLGGLQHRVGPIQEPEPRKESPEVPLELQTWIQH